MAKKNDTRFFENKLLDFVTAKDPLLEMLQWMMDKFMEIEVARKTGAPKGSHSQGRTGYRCGYRVRRFDTRLGTVYLSVPKKILHGTSWQRCKVHFMRNILAYVPQKDKEKVAARLRLIWSAPDEKSARAMKSVFCQEYEKSFPKAVECLEEVFEDSV